MPSANFGLGRAADLCSVGAVLCPLLPLPRALEPYRASLFVPAFVGSTWLVSSLIGAQARVRKLGRASIGAPVVVLVGGPESKATSDAIVDSPALQTQPYIKYKALLLDGAQGGRFTRSQITELEGADAIILMSDFTRARCPEAYAWFMMWSRSRAECISRYREQANTREPVDFPFLPFSTPEGVVNYASEFLLRRTVDRARYIDGKQRLSARVTALALAMTVFISLVAVAYFGIYVTMRRMIETPPSARHLAAITLEKRRKAIEADSALSPMRLDAEREFFQGLAKLRADDLVRIFKLPVVPTLAVYVPSRDGRLLMPIEGYGFQAYELDGRESIAACALRLGGVVFWYGRNSTTLEIRAWTLSGEEVGEYDEDERRLKLPDGGSCAYDVGRGSDPKNQLVCLPTVTDESPADPSMAALCVALDAALIYLDGWLVHSYLIDVAPGFGPFYILKALSGADGEEGPEPPVGLPQKTTLAR